MGTFHVGCQIENHKNSRQSLKIKKLLVDTGAVHTWIRDTKLMKIGIMPVKKDVPLSNGQWSIDHPQYWIHGDSGQ